MAKRIAVLTSGGDAPGMNAAIRAVVRTGDRPGLGGVRRPARLSRADRRRFRPAGRARCGRHHAAAAARCWAARAARNSRPKKAAQTRAAQAGRSEGIEALVVIGGNGSQTGAHALLADGLPGGGRRVDHRQRPATARTSPSAWTPRSTSRWKPSTA